MIVRVNSTLTMVYYITKCRQPAFTPGSDKSGGEVADGRAFITLTYMAKGQIQNQPAVNGAKHLFEFFFFPLKGNRHIWPDEKDVFFEENGYGGFTQMETTHEPTTGAASFVPVKAPERISAVR
jgi:hypothetical protein